MFPTLFFGNLNDLPKGDLLDEFKVNDIELSNLYVLLMTKKPTAVHMRRESTAASSKFYFLQFNAKQWLRVHPYGNGVEWPNNADLTLSDLRAKICFQK